MLNPEEASADSPAPRWKLFLRGIDLFLVSMLVLTIAKSMLARGLAIDPSVALSALWLDAGIAVLVIGAAATVFAKRSHLLMLAVYSIYSFLLFGDAIYAEFFDQMLDPQLMGLAGQAGDMSGEIVSLLRPIYLCFFIDIPVFAFWAIAPSRYPTVRRRLAVSIAVPVALAVVVAQVALVTSSPAGTDSTSTATQWGITSMQLASLRSMAFPSEKHAFADVAAKAEVPVGSSASTETAAQRAMRLFNDRMGEYAPVGGTRIAPFPEGVAKGKHVFVVQFESLMRMFVNAKVNGQYVTPNVNRFVKDSYDFPNTYSQTGGGNTSDAEFMIATSMLPAMQQCSTAAYGDRVIPAMPSLLGEQGYRTITLHTNTAEFWFRKDLFAAVGFQKYYDKSYFKDRDMMWRGSSDEVLFKEGARAVKKELKRGQPIFAMFVTMTSHLHYNLPRQDRRPLQLPARYEDSYLGKYAGAISYADKAFGDFIDDLKKAGLYDESVIVLIGDHTGGYKETKSSAEDDEIIRQLLGRKLSWVDHQRVAFAVHVPHQKPKVVKSMRAMQDIMPTIADLTGIDTSTTPHFGRSAFVEGPRLAPFRAYFPGGSYADNDIVFVAGASERKDKAFDIRTGRQVAAPARRESRLEMVRQFNSLSDEWLSSQPVRQGAVSRSGTAPKMTAE
jgi:phosphoglycerol transferase MdoB-like AlkP superfamily enzyme